MPPKLTLCHRRSLYRQPPDYLGWPSLAKSAEGTLLCVFSGGRECHVCPYGRLLLTQSHDEGETWSAPEIIMSTPLDDRDPGIVVLPSGAWLVTWFTLDTGRRLRSYREYYPRQADSWARHLSKVSWEARDYWPGHWSRRSADGGRSWLDPVPSLASAPHGPLLCPSGRLVYVGTAKGQRLVAVESKTAGDDWHLLGEIAYAPPRREPAVLNEPHGVALNDDELVVLWRHEPAKQTWAPTPLYVTRSADGGETWSTPVATELVGHPPHLLRLADGRLLVTYGYRQPPFGVRAVVVDPARPRWVPDHELVLVDDCENWDCGYPATVELAPGELYTVYYEADNFDCGTIWGVRWRLEG
jgi:sialidase-1